MDRRLTAVGLGAATTGLLAGATLVGGRELLRRQAAHARTIIGKPLGEDTPRIDKLWKPKYGDPIRLVVLGDSIAAGLGADRKRNTLGSRIARKVAKRSERSVDLRSVAVVGSESSDLPTQLAALPEWFSPDVAVIVVGGNDVTHRVPTSVSIGHLRDAIAELQRRGARVAVGTCPDLGALRALRQPLRGLASRASRQLAAAQRRAAVDMGATPVALGKVVGRLFIDDPERMFAEDQFHPSSLGYKRTAQALVPVVLELLESEVASAPAQC